MVAVMTATKHFEPADSSSQSASPYTLVVGLGASGLAAARYLSDRGESLLVIDSRAAPPALEALQSESPEIAVELETLDSKWLKGASRIVLSPGLPVDLPLIADARQRGIEIAGELELFAQAASAPVLAVTGSNGKSTVASLVAVLLEAQGFKAPAGGNLGPPALELLKHDPVDAYVVEISSFQLETTRSLKPLAAALLNISPDHIDRHGSLEHYAALKGSLLATAGRAIANWDDPLVREIVRLHANAIPFSVKEPLCHAWSVIEHRGERWLAHELVPLIRSSELNLTGEIGEANVLAALALAQSLGGELDLAFGALRRFRGLNHRLQFVLERQGVSYVDDSKGTNVGATVAAITGAHAPIILIAGGQSKGADFGILAEAVEGRVKAAILIGEAASQLERAFEGRTQTVMAPSMSAAVAAAARIAQPGDRVMLSPACASQDMYADYADRGEAFAAAVRELPQ